jgi:hypothetical protein
VKRITVVTILLLLAVMCSTVNATTELAQPKKYVAFRDDDVRPFESLDTLKAVNQVHIDENVPVTLGIIPHPREGQGGNQLLQDDQFLTYARSIASSPLFEFAQHGYSHKDILPSGSQSEFSGLPYDDQYNHIFWGQTDMKEAFGATPTTFIPPFNTGDSNTTKAAAALGFTEYSIGFSFYKLHYGSQNGMRMEGSFDIGATSDAAFSTSIQNAQNETERFLGDPQSGDTLTFTYHAAVFGDSQGVVDSHKVQQLSDFISFLKTKGVLFTRLDRSNQAEDGAAVSPSLGEVQTVLTTGKSIPPTFLLVGSVGIVLSGIYVIAQRQSGPEKPKDK